MKRILLACIPMLCFGYVQAQTTYYWVGGAPVGPVNISTAANWNTSLDGTGSPKSASLGSTSNDILIFDGSNTGGTTPTTGLDSVNLNTSFACTQIRFINAANIVFVRLTSGTSTITITGDGSSAEDFVIEGGCSVKLANGPGSQVFAFGANNTGRVSGNLSMITGLQASLRNTTSGRAGSLIFTSGANFYTNITSASASYAFGNSTQSSEKWVVFQPGASLYYDGGSSPMGSASAGPFQPVEFMAGSNYYIRTSNLGVPGVFTNRKAYANVIIQNGATLTADGPVSRIDTLIVTSGSTFTTHAGGQTVVSGDVVIDGTLNAPPGSTNELMLAGSTLQTVSGSGSISPASLVVADGAHVVLNANISVARSALVNGKIDFTNYQVGGAGSFSTRPAAAPVSGTGNLTAGAYLITGVTGASGLNRGISISGAGLPAGTIVSAFTANFDSIYITRPVQTSGSNVTLTFSNAAATLATGNTNGFDATNGSVIVADVKTYTDGINYVINAPTASPFGISTGSATNRVNVNDLGLNAPATTNSTVYVSGNLQLNSGKLIIRPLDTVYLLNTATLSGSFNSSSYFVTGVNTTTGAQGILRVDGISASKLLPVGTPDNFLPATLNPSSPSDVAVAVFEGITTDGTPNGTALSGNQKLTKVDAVWTINRLNGTGDAGLQLQWTPSLEGTAFTTLADSEIGIITNQNPGWSLPVSSGDNTNNTASATPGTFGAFGIGAKPPAQPFIFNPLPDKTYGDPDFDPGAISLNTTNPIVYTSSNAAVATIVSGKVHVTGVGTATVTASQTGDGFYPDVSQSQSLTVVKAGLTIRADDKSKPEGDPNPALTVTYTGFVNGETQSVLTTPVSVSTAATTASPAGTYPITVSGATATNYTITFVNGTLTVTPRQNQTITFNAPPAKTYGNADFAAGATSTNTTIPITYTSSNTSVATIVGSNIHIVGAGTATITASQPGNTFYFPAQPVSRTLTVNKANLTVRAQDTVRNYGEPNPSFVITYSGFVLGETAGSLTTQPGTTTTATATTAPGYYPIVVGGGVSNNYNFVYTNGRLTILPATGSKQPNLQAFMSSSNILTVRVYSTVPDLADIILYDMTGKPVLKKNVFLPNGFITVTLSVSGLSSGLYSVTVNGQIVKLKKNVTIAR